MKSNRFYHVIVALVRPLLHLIFPHRVIGRENVPLEGPVMLCSNHVSMIDPLFIAAAVRREVRFISKKELFDNRLLGAFLTRLGMFPVDRGGSDMAAMRSCIGILKEGGALGIFPQGHRFKHDENREMQSGAALMAIRTKAPVIPIHVSGPVRPFHRTTVRIGAPVGLEDISRPDAAALGEATKRLTAAIWEEDAAETTGA